MKIPKTILNFDEFQNLWLEQECEGMDSLDDIDQLKEEIGDCRDYKDIFRTINLWSHKPLNERVQIFLNRNNAKLDEEGQIELAKA